MWSVSESICMMILLIVSVRDIQIRKISEIVLVAAGIGSVFYQLCTREMNWWLIAGGAVVGGIFLIISKVTEEGIGYGDSFMILILGIFLGMWDILIVLLIAFFLLLCVLIPLLWSKKMSRTCTLPFLPFLTGGYLCFLLMGGK